MNMRFVIALLLVFLPRLAFAQDDPPILVVNLHDQHGLPIVGALVIVHDHSGTQEFARTQTDLHGQALISSVAASDVRVRVQGKLPDDMPLVQIGNDAHGVAMMLIPPTNQLDLRADERGLVIPDPASMITADLSVDGSAQELPTRIPMVPTARIPTVNPRLVVAGAVPPTAIQEPIGNRDSDVTIGILLLLVLAMALGMLMLFIRPTVGKQQS